MNTQHVITNHLLAVMFASGGLYIARSMMCVMFQKKSRLLLSSLIEHFFNHLKLTEGRSGEYLTGALSIDFEIEVSVFPWKKLPSTTTPFKKKSGNNYLSKAAKVSKSIDVIFKRRICLERGDLELAIEIDD